ncbi:hypothetical protein ACVWZ4_005091 [Bradyrhizobium sp. USDA 4472]
MPGQLSLDTLNRASRADFVAALGETYRGS